MRVSGYRPKRYLLACCVIYCSFPITGNASELFQLTLEQLLNVKVTGATKVSTPFLSVPASSNVFDRAALDMMGVRTLQELVPFVPGFHIAHNDDDRYPSLTARGRRTGASGREVLVLLDGLRIDNWFTGGAFMSAPDISLGGMKQVEFIRGAVSQVYGSNAFTGVINMVTDPGLRNISLLAGENDAYHLQTNLGSQHNDFSHKLFLNLASEGGETTEVSPYLQPEPVPMNDGYQAGEANYQLHLGNWSLLSQFNHSEQEQFYTAGNLQPQFGGVTHEYATLALQHRTPVSNTLRLVSQFGYNYFDWRSDMESLPAGALQNVSSPPSQAPLRLRIKENTSEEYWLNLDAQWQPSNQNQTLLGLEWRYRNKAPLRLYGNYDLAALNSQDFPITYFGDFDTAVEGQPQASERMLAALLQTIQQFGSRNELTLGLRYDNYELAGERFSPRLAWVHKVGSVHALKLLYSEAFRAPVSNEYYLTNNPVLLGNPDLKPETVKTSEIIWVSELPSMRLQLGYFHSHYLNPIAQSAGDIRQFRNLEDSFSAGFEGNLSMQLATRWLARINFSHLTQKPDDQYRQPDNLVTLATNFQQQSWSWFYDIQYASKRYNTGEQNDELTPLDAYWLHNTKLSYQYTRRAKITLRIDNVFDESIVDPSLSGGGNEIPRRGRHLSLVWQLDL